MDIAVTVIVTFLCNALCRTRILARSAFPELGN